MIGRLDRGTWRLSAALFRRDGGHHLAGDAMTGNALVVDGGRTP
jgi:hypothetical protein